MAPSAPVTAASASRSALTSTSLRVVAPAVLEGLAPDVRVVLLSRLGSRLVTRAEHGIEEVREECDAREACGWEDVRRRLFERVDEQPVLIRHPRARKRMAKQPHPGLDLPVRDQLLREVGRLRREAPLEWGLQELADLVDELRGVCRRHRERGLGHALMRLGVVGL